MNLKAKQWIDGNIGKALVLINVIIIRGIGLLIRRDHSLKEEPKNILVIKMLGLGSVLMAMDSIYSLKLRYPNAKIILMCGKGVFIGVKPFSIFDEIWVHDDRTILSMIGSGITLLFKTFKLKKLWVVDLEVYSILTTLFSAWTTSLNRFGFQLNKVNFRNYLNTHNIFFNQFITVNQNYEQLVQAMGVKEIKPYIFSTSNERNPFPQKVIAINNTCSELGGELRKIPISLLKNICDFLIKHTPYTLALTGAPSDFEANQKCLVEMQLNQSDRIANIAGQFSFESYYSFMQHHCVALLSIDSAPFHMAIKVDIPTLTFWGPINPIQRFNYANQNKHYQYYLNTKCSPCIHLSDVIPCGGDNICMKNMEIKEIEKLINQLLKITTNGS